MQHIYSIKNTENFCTIRKQAKHTYQLCFYLNNVLEYYIDNFGLHDNGSFSKKYFINNILERLKNDVDKNVIDMFIDAEKLHNLQHKIE